MTMQASTLGILEAADFSPKQARALAQAIEGEIKGSDLVTASMLDARNYVTVPDLKARLTELKLSLKLDLSEMENRLTNKMLGFGLSIASLGIAAVYFLVLHLRN